MTILNITTRQYFCPYWKDCLLFLLYIISSFAIIIALF